MGHCGGVKLYHLACSCAPKKSELTGRHKCHIHPMENVTLTQKEQTRLQVLNSFLTEHIALDQAAELMGVSPRHTRRILAAYQERGAAALAHGHRGRRPANAIPEATRRAGWFTWLARCVRGSQPHPSLRVAQ